MFVTIGAEQFGTNLRATAATTIPNMMRGTVVIMTTLFVNLKQVFSVTASAMLIGLLCFIVSISVALSISETHGTDLNFVETDP